MRFSMFIMLAALFFNVADLQGQSDDKKNKANEKADKIYEKLGYKEAIDLYREGKLDMKAMEHIANGYRLNGDTRNAEKWYSQIVTASDNPLNYLYYAQALHSNGNLEKAKENYLKYDKMMGGSDKRGARLAAAIYHKKDFSQRTDVVIKLENSVNSPKLDFSPAFFENGIVFVSNREPEGKLAKVTNTKDNWTGDDFTTLYFAKATENGSLGKPENYDGSLSSRFHDGPLTFSRTGDLLLYTKNNVKSGGWTMLKQLAKGREELKLKIYSAEKSGDGWGDSEPVDLGDKASNDAHPALSPDGQKLFFSSDREGGLGGMDLYVSHFTGGSWSAPVNLGPNINTPGNELFPFVYDDGTLYFASDGWGGFGGLDIFYADKITEIEWSAAQNIGAPFNSIKDDFGYILDVFGTEGYFTSSREGGAGKDDIYSFSLPGPQANKTTNKINTSTICAQDATNGNGLSGVKISVMEQLPEGGYQGYEDDFVVKLVPTDVAGEFAISLKKRDPFSAAPKETQTYMTDENGSFAVELDPEKQYIFIAKKSGYTDMQQLINLEELNASGADLSDCIPIKLAPSNCISLQGRVLNKRYNNPIPGATVTLMNLCTGDLKTVKSDAEGNYDFACIDCNCDFIIQGSKNNFKQDNNLASTTGMNCEAANETISRDLLLIPTLDKNGNANVASYHPEDKEHPVEEFLNDPDALDRVLEEGLTIELEDIYYDFDKYNIRPDAAIELDKVIALMRRHPDLSVQLRSHTDVRGDDEYNMRLSDNRAQSAMAYIVSRGISGHRISDKGYGETWLVNECGDGVPCEEPAHQMNRRTEIRVFKERR